MEELLSDLDRVYQGIQHLQLEPTKINTAIVLDALQVMENVYRFIKERSEEVKADGNADTE